MLPYIEMLTSSGKHDFCLLASFIFMKIKHGFTTNKTEIGYYS